MQFGFRPLHRTIDAVFTAIETWQYCKKNSYHVFVGLEKAFDEVPREVNGWTLSRPSSRSYKS